jgi:hypothetical protein
MPGTAHDGRSVREVQLLAPGALAPKPREGVRPDTFAQLHRALQTSTMVATASAMSSRGTRHESDMKEGGSTVEELLVRDGEVEQPGTAEDPVEWARAHLQVTVNAHDRLQTAFITTLRTASIGELRVIVGTYAGLDRVAETRRKGELAWKSAAADAALAARLRAAEDASADHRAPVQGD